MFIRERSARPKVTLAYTSYFPRSSWSDWVLESGPKALPPTGPKTGLDRPNRPGQVPPVIFQTANYDVNWKFPRGVRDSYKHTERERERKTSMVLG